MILWTCVDCGHEVLAKKQPSPIKRIDGHTCNFSKFKIRVAVKSGRPAKHATR